MRLHGKLRADHTAADAVTHLLAPALSLSNVLASAVPVPLPDVLAFPVALTYSDAYSDAYAYAYAYALTDPDAYADTIAASGSDPVGPRARDEEAATIAPTKRIAAQAAFAGIRRTQSTRE